MEARAAECAAFDHHHFKALFCRQERRLGASRPGTYNCNLIFFTHIPGQAYRPLESPTTGLFELRQISVPYRPRKTQEMSLNFDPEAIEEVQ
jgi:hypothetical protein